MPLTTTDRRQLSQLRRATTVLGRIPLGTVLRQVAIADRLLFEDVPPKRVLLCEVDGRPYTVPQPIPGQVTKRYAQTVESVGFDQAATDAADALFTVTLPENPEDRTAVLALVEAVMNAEVMRCQPKS